MLQFGFSSVRPSSILRGSPPSGPNAPSREALESREVQATGAIAAESTKAPSGASFALPSHAVAREDRFELTAEAKSVSGRELTSEDQSKVDELKQRDREVRSHEQAHKSAGGQYAGAISYEYTTGPDGKRYASGGSVPIDTSAIEGNPDATIRKMQQVHAAAVAPSDPSSADRNVAAIAQRNLSQAQNEKRELDRAEIAGESATTAEASSASARVFGDAVAEPADAPLADVDRAARIGGRTVAFEGKPQRGSSTPVLYSPEGAAKQGSSRVGLTLDRSA